MSAAPTNAVPSPRRAGLAWPLPVAGLVVVALFTVYPPFRVVPRQSSSTATTETAAFAPARFAADFWEKRLLPAANAAPDAGTLLASLRSDPAAARARAHQVGLGNAAYYFVRGTGRVVAVERSHLLVEIDGAKLALRTGPVFGNVVRDGCGLLEVNQVPGLAEFNALSAELNRLVEERVQPALKSAAVGATVTFAGCAEAPETLPADGPLLTFIPVQAEVKS